MISVLEKPEIRRRALPMSVAAYHVMFQQGLVEERAELIRGVVIEKMPKSPLHARITAILQRELQLALPNFWVRKEDPLSLADSEPEPDISIVLGRAEEYTDRHPSSALIVVEVAVTSEELDREKAEIYAEAGVGEYWIVLANERVVEVHTGAKDGHWTNIRRVAEGEELQPTMFPAVRLALRDIFPA